MTCSGEVPLLASRAIRPWSSRSLPLTVAPPINCSACERFESLSRSHSQASSRAGRPNVFRKGFSILPSGIWVARAPRGSPSKAVVVAVTVEIASSNTSAGKSLVWAWEK